MTIVVAARIDVRRGQRLIGVAGWTGNDAAVASLLLELGSNGGRARPATGAATRRA